MSTLGLSLVRRTSSLSAASGNTQTVSKPDRSEETKQNFPTAEYDEPDLADPAKNAAKKEKQKRHNNFKWVGKNPQSWQAESVVIPEGNFDFPALPVSRSQLIVVGRVGEASAHLSEHKMNVYSEFLIAVSSVLKTPTQGITENSLLAVERLGGMVRYPTGQKVLFRVSGWNMPKVGSDYLFFLNTRNKLDWEIVTAYELTEAGVLPLDESSQFEALRGTPSIEILKQVRALISEQITR
ncbi:MAG TPA: hypothetical protein VJ875_09660 [Pyrinomonadaceae bacterium]|nr:hypothetical protein [Pyrinomonadaceae bacterium]